MEPARSSNRLRGDRPDFPLVIGRTSRELTPVPGREAEVNAARITLARRRAVSAEPIINFPMHSPSSPLSVIGEENEQGRREDEEDGSSSSESESVESEETDSSSSSSSKPEKTEGDKYTPTSKKEPGRTGGEDDHSSSSTSLEEDKLQGNEDCTIPFSQSTVSTPHQASLNQNTCTVSNKTLSLDTTTLLASGTGTHAYAGPSYRSQESTPILGKHRSPSFLSRKLSLFGSSNNYALPVTHF